MEEEERKRRKGKKDFTANICHSGDFSCIFVYKMSNLHRGKHHDNHSNRQVCVLSHRYGAYRVTFLF